MSVSPEPENRVNEHHGDKDSPKRSIFQFRTSPGRFIFTERDNTDGWIATDVVADLKA